MPEAFALLSACCAAMSSILLNELKGRLSLLQLVRRQTLTAFAVTCAISVAVDGWRTVEPYQFGLLLASGAAGIIVAGTAYIATIHAVGPRITALLFSLTSPFTLCLGYVFLGETISALQAFGVLLVLAGIVLAIGVPRRFLTKGWIKPPMPVPAPSAVPLAKVQAPPRTGRLMPGIVLGILTAFGQSIGTLLARPVMASGIEPFTAMAIRMGMGAGFFILLAFFGVRSTARQLVDWRSWSLVIGAALLGTTLGMAFLMAALRDGKAGVVATLSTVTPVVILPMVWLLGREVPSWTAWTGAILAMFGTALISMG
jgi:drug/metabolite transporter (DMT)-like permease